MAGRLQRPISNPDPGAGLDHEDGYQHPGLFHPGREAFGG